MADVGEALFYIESRRRDGTWQKFSEVIEGRGAAEKHLVFVQDYCREIGRDVDGVRLHEMSEDEMRSAFITKHRDRLMQYLHDQPLDTLKEIVGVCGEEP